MAKAKKIVKPFPYFGGKAKIAQELYQLMPLSYIKHFVDVFGGSMTVGLNYPNASIAITTCDVNEDIINFFDVLRDKQEVFIRALRLTPCAEMEYKRAWEGMRANCPVERARCFFIRSTMGFYGLGSQKTKKGKSIGFSRGTNSNNCKGRTEVVSRWNNGVERLLEVAQIIRNRVQVISSGYQNTIKFFDGPTNFFYVDPPYDLESRSASGEYAHDFTEVEHRDLADRLRGVKSLVMISGYRSKLMKELYEDYGWKATKLKHSHYSNLSRRKIGEDKQEWVWTNYDPTLFNQQILFPIQQ